MNPTLRRVVTAGARCRRALSTAAPLELSYDVVEVEEPRCPPLVLVHGLYGSKTNWRSTSKAFARKLGTTVYSVDLRNHGTSPHAKPTDYATMAGDLLHFFERHKLEKVNLLGHSMGGGTSMTLALRPDVPRGLVDKLIIEDVAPYVSPRVSREFTAYAGAMRALVHAQPKTRKEADALLEPAVPDTAVRAFLMTNLVSSSDASAPLTWRIPHFMIEDSALDEIRKFPYAEGSGVVYNGDALFVRGARSRYLSEERIQLVKHFFPHARIETLDTGHWVHAERPSEFVGVVSDFIQS